jgi:hypothetical protein
MTNIHEIGHIEAEASEHSSGTGGNTVAGSLQSRLETLDFKGSGQNHIRLSAADPENIKALSFGLTYSCALADTVIFDKTDTLTAARMKVSRISTASRDYGLLETGLPDSLHLMLEDSRRNALKYLITEEQEDEQHATGDSSAESKDIDSDNSESSQQ